MKKVGFVKYTIVEIKSEEMDLLVKLLRLDDEAMKRVGFTGNEIKLSEALHTDILKCR